MSAVMDPPIVRDLLVRAEKRLQGAISRRGRVDHPEVLALTRRYAAREVLLRAVLAGPVQPRTDGLMALAEALAEPVVSPVLLDNARAEADRRYGLGDAS